MAQIAPGDEFTLVITEAYREQQQQMHENPDYGVASVGYAPMVNNLVNTLQVAEMLDYGAGKGRLLSALKPDHDLAYRAYEPANPEWCDTPEPAEMVCCIDVLEHVEPELLDEVLDDLQRVTKRCGFFSIHTGPAVKTLPDGRNAHLIQHDYRWWMPKLWDRFHVDQMSHTKGGFFTICRSQITQS